jgi:hypothetical protein
MNYWFVFSIKGQFQEFSEWFFWLNNDGKWGNNFIFLNLIIFVQPDYQEFKENKNGMYRKIDVF